MKEREIQSLEGRVVRKVPADKVTFQWEMVECESEKMVALCVLGVLLNRLVLNFLSFYF